MKTTSLLLIASLLVIGDTAATTSVIEYTPALTPAAHAATTALPPLTARQRAALVAQFKSAAAFADFASEAYAYTPNEVAYWHGQAIAYANAAYWLEHTPQP